jgi:hypothetical protein
LVVSAQPIASTDTGVRFFAARWPSQATFVAVAYHAISPSGGQHGVSELSTMNRIERQAERIPQQDDEMRYRGRSL